MIRFARTILACAASAVALTACADYLPVQADRSVAGPIPGQPSISVPPVADIPVGEKREFGGLVYRGADLLAQRSSPLPKDRPIVVATMVSQNDYRQSSPFGRLASQLIANRLVQDGYLINDLTYTSALVMQAGTGVLVLSDEARRVATVAKAQAVIVGTYAVGGREIYLNIRLLRAGDGVILSSADVALPLDDNTRAMVGE
jgi:hypothetical protein